MTGLAKAPLTLSEGTCILPILHLDPTPRDALGGQCCPQSCASSRSLHSSSQARVARALAQPLHWAARSTLKHCYSQTVSVCPCFTLLKWGQETHAHCWTLEASAPSQPLSPRSQSSCLRNGARKVLLGFLHPLLGLTGLSGSQQLPQVSRGTVNNPPK